MSVLSMILSVVIAVATPAPQHLGTVVVRAPKADLTLQIATTEAQRELGLMSVTKLEPQTGMVFVFAQDDQVAFWMKDTFIPLDMIFVAKDGTVRTVAANVPATKADTPDAQIPRRTGRGMFVIELAAGEAAKDGIVAGSHLEGLEHLHGS